MRRIAVYVRMTEADLGWMIRGMRLAKVPEANLRITVASYQVRNSRNSRLLNFRIQKTIPAIEEIFAGTDQRNALVRMVVAP